ncbi:hypothetical protein GCM10027282_04080 [Frigoribacterium salinisoli]
MARVPHERAVLPRIREGTTLPDHPHVRSYAAAPPACLRVMIIEAGYGLHFLLAPTVREERLEGVRHSLWALGTDRDLRLVSLDAVADWRGHDLGQYGDAIARALDVEHADVAHYALAYWSPVVLKDDRLDLRGTEYGLAAHPALVARDLLGVAAYDDEGFRNTFPRFEFNEYLSYEHLPRAHVLSGPHELQGCPCAACRQQRSRLHERGRRRDARESRRGISEYASTPGTTASAGCTAAHPPEHQKFWSG